MTDKQLAVLLKKYEDMLADAIHSIEDIMEERAREDGTEYNYNDNYWLYEPFWDIIGKINDDCHLLANDSKAEEI